MNHQGAKGTKGHQERRLLFASCLLVSWCLGGETASHAEDVPGVKRGTWVGKALDAPGGRSPFASDPILVKFLKDGDLATPADAQDGWARLAEDGNEVRPQFGNGYAAATIESDAERVVLVRASGNAWAAVNGSPLAGDIYRAGAPPLPVALSKGANHVLVRLARGGFSFAIEPAPTGIAIDGGDATLPDIRAGVPLDSWGQVVLVNASANPLQGVQLEVAGSGFAKTSTAVPPIPPLTAVKARFAIKTESSISGAASAAFTVKAIAEGSSASRDFSLRVRSPGESWKETFVSEIDGSVQYFAVRAPSKVDDSRRYGLVLSLHGAGVEATGQVDAYSTKEWCYVVAATNRRPFGFDWEDWGRDDALEVLALAQKRFPIDPLRVYLAGHSMGGHGTWHVGVTFPDRFAAISPSAGWISFFSYAGVVRPDGAESPRTEIFARALGPSDTLSLLPNLRDLGVFVIHGDKDDNVPVTEARKITTELQRFHKDLRYHEEPGAGHWWSKTGPGADCVNMEDLFSFLSRRSRAETPRAVSFRTWNPGISSRSAWVEIERQEKHLAHSSVEANVLPGAKKLEVKTSNVSCLAFDLAPFMEAGPVQVVLDGTASSFEWDGKKPLRLEHAEGKWVAAAPRDPLVKNPERYGPFKRAFAHRFVLVYGTGGTEAENRAAYDKARYDAQTWSYRANGTAELVPDTAFRPDADQDRGVVLYGHQDMNKAFKAVLDSPAVTVERGRVRVGEKTFEGEDLLCLAAFPRKGSDRAMVAVVGGTGPAGMRLALSAPYLASGVAYPDFVVLDVGALSSGLAGVKACGILDERWGLARALVDGEH